MKKKIHGVYHSTKQRTVLYCLLLTYCTTLQQHNRIPYLKATHQPTQPRRNAVNFIIASPGKKEGGRRKEENH